MSEIEERLCIAESKISTVEREFNNSWAYGSRSEYEERFKHEIVNKLSAKIFLFLTALIATFGTALFIYIGITVESKVIAKVDEKIKIVKVEESERVNKIIAGVTANFDWRQSHDFGYVYRNLAKVFWEDKTIKDKNKKRWISQVLKLAIEKLEKAEKKDAVRGSTYWELGNLAYILPVKYHTDTENSALAESYFEKAIRLYDQAEIEEGWRGGAYEDLARVQVSISLLHKGTNKGVSYEKRAICSKQLALRDYKELVKKYLHWRNASIIRLENELGRSSVLVQLNR